MTILIPQQWDAIVIASFDRPSFRLPTEALNLIGDAFLAFRPANVRAADFRMEGATTTPSEIAVNCALLDAGMNVKFRAENVEVWTNRAHPAHPLFAQTAAAAIQVALRRLQPEAQLSSLTFSIGVHALADSTAQAPAVGPLGLIPSPPGLRASGISFEGEAKLARGATLVVERSFVLPQATFVKVTAMFDEAVAVADAIASTLNFRTDVLRALELSIKEG